MGPAQRRWPPHLRRQRLEVGPVEFFEQRPAATPRLNSVSDRRARKESARRADFRTNSSQSGATISVMIAWCSAAKPAVMKFELMSSLEFRDHDSAGASDAWPIVVEHHRPDALLPVRSEGRFNIGSEPNSPDPRTYGTQFGEGSISRCDPGCFRQGFAKSETCTDPITAKSNASLTSPPTSPPPFLTDGSLRVWRLLDAGCGARTGQPGRRRHLAAQHRHAGRQTGSYRVWPGPGGRPAKARRFTWYARSAPSP